MLLKLDNIVWRDEPYRIGLAKPVMDESLYQELVAAFPASGELPKGARKMALSERCHNAGFMEFVNASPLWKRFHTYIKSADFFDSVYQATGLQRGPRYTSRFEFSSFPANGGGLDPHTDIPSKVVTIVIPMLRDAGEWGSSWGGGTDVLKPLTDKPLKDYEAPLSEFEKVRTYAYEPNQAVVFLKSSNSWHSVTCTGPAGHFRRSVCVNIERAA